MLLFTNTTSPRLTYISNFIGNEIGDKNFEITSDKNYFFNYEGLKINYSNTPICTNEFRIENVSLLFESEITEQKIACFQIENCKAFFKTNGDYPFDIFAASFYLLSRYEEYYPHQKDKYGRYAHENSLAFKENFLHHPLVNIWIEDFKKTIQQKFPTHQFAKHEFSFLLTYDIDEAFAYLHKSWWRTVGAIAKAIYLGQWNNIYKRIKVLIVTKDDPYDSFSWMDELNEKYALHPIYFFLVASKNGRRDKNILPTANALQKLIYRLSQKYFFGIHPSWQTGDDKKLLQNEINTLETITKKKPRASRQHYLRFSLPQTFRDLQETGITDDYSMGYGTTNGFRASVASSFFWYDLQNENISSLKLHPFCLMDATFFHQQKLTIEKATEEMQSYFKEVKAVNGQLIFIAHNNYLGTEEFYKGWKEKFEQFICSIKN